MRPLSLLYLGGSVWLRKVVPRLPEDHIGMRLAGAGSRAPGRKPDIAILDAHLYGAQVFPFPDHPRIAARGLLNIAVRTVGRSGKSPADQLTGCRVQNCFTLPVIAAVVDVPPGILVGSDLETARPGIRGDRSDRSVRLDHDVGNQTADVTTASAAAVKLNQVPDLRRELQAGVHVPASADR